MADPSSSMVTNDQANGLGGADKQAGITGKDTFQVSDTRQVVVIARYTPAAGPFTPDGMDAATGLIGSVTGAVKDAAGAVEDAMAMIPGVQMFIKEDKKNSPSQKEYKYEYKDWDAKVPEVEANLQKLFAENKVFNWTFSATDEDGVKEEARKNYNADLKSKLSGWSQYTVWIHLIGIGQGGNLVNEVGNLLAGDSQFQSENWKVKSVFYIGTPFYAGIHQLNAACLKEEGAVFNFNCTLDLTQQVIPFFTPADDFVKFIQNSNSNTMSLMVGKITLTIVKILSLFLGSSSIGFTDPHGLDKFGSIKPEIENLVKQMTGMIKQIVTEITSFIDPGKLPDFGAALNGFGDVPAQTGKRFTSFLSDLGDAVENQVKSIFGGTGSLGPQNLMGIFNCLCPLLDQIANLLSLLDYQTPATLALANQMIENAGITDIYPKGEAQGSSISLDSSIAAQYLQERLNKYQETGKIDKISQMITDATGMLTELEGNSKVKVSDLSDEQKAQLAGALYSIIQPMLISKRRFLEELHKWIGKLDIGSALDDIKANKLLDMGGKALNNITTLQFEQPLQDSINAVDAQIARFKGYLQPHEYDLYQDTLYFVFDIHNEVINPFHDVVKQKLYEQADYDEEKYKDPEPQIAVSKVPETANGQ